jgi:hypothetical protein
MKSLSDSSVAPRRGDFFTLAKVARWTDGNGRNRVAVANNLRTMTQGSS